MENAAAKGEGRLRWQKWTGYGQGQQASTCCDAFSRTDHPSSSLPRLWRSVPSNWEFLIVSNLSWESPTLSQHLPCTHPSRLYRKGGREQFAPLLVNNWLNNSAKHSRWSEREMLAFRQRRLSYQIKRKRFFKSPPPSPSDLNCHDFPFFLSIPQGGEYNSSNPVLGVRRKPELGSPLEGKRNTFWILPGNKYSRAVCDSL